MKRNAPTIKEIAKMLNLSVSTVSRALHSSADISEATTKRVKDVAEELGYEPNQTALFLQSGRTLTLGVILPHLSEAFFSEAISGIEDYASEHNYNVLMGQSHDSTEREKKIVEAMKNHRVDGILVSIAKNTKQFDHFDMLKKYDIPVVYFDRVPEREDAHTVTCQLEAGGNLYASEVNTGRYDASMGLYLRGNGKGNFSAVSAMESGFIADGDAKGIAELTAKNGDRIVVIGNNSRAVEAYKLNKTSRNYQAKKDDAYAIITSYDGTKRKCEFYYGSTYLSQSSRGINAFEVKQLEVYNFKGEKSREIGLE